MVGLHWLYDSCHYKHVLLLHSKKIAQTIDTLYAQSYTMISTVVDVCFFVTHGCLFSLSAVIMSCVAGIVYFYPAM